MGSAKAKVFPQVRWLVSAPGRIRTRDPLLRRQLLCPAELRAPERNCARPTSRDGHAKVPVCRPLATQIRPRVRQQPTVPEPTVNDDSSAAPKPLNCGSVPNPDPPELMIMCSSGQAPKTAHDHETARAARCRPAAAPGSAGGGPGAPRSQPARAHGRSGPESPQREKNAQEAAPALGPRGSEYRAEAGSAEPPATTRGRTPWPRARRSRRPARAPWTAG